MKSVYSCVSNEPSGCDHKQLIFSLRLLMQFVRGNVVLYEVLPSEGTSDKDRPMITITYLLLLRSSMTTSYHQDL